MNLEPKSDPCSVCGETNSTGWHFGTITCEACKKFFIRNSESEHEQFKCVRSNNCVITKSTRTNCPQCRYQKCLQVGMNSNEKSGQKKMISFKEIKCTVCGDASSGLHFGAITCEGCKGFFRRVVREGHQTFICQQDGNCEINMKTRNVCRYCRFQRCLDKNMSVTNSKIGRQSNLFKYKLMKNKNMDSSEVNPELAKLEDLKIPFMSMNPINIYDVNIEDSLDPRTRNFIKTIFSAYKDSIESTVTYGYGDMSQHFGNYFQGQCEYSQVHKFLGDLINKCIRFLQKSLSDFHTLNEQEQYKILANAIHPIRLLQLTNDSEFGNYLGYDSETYKRICQIFPVFAEIDIYFNSLNQLIKSLKLDSKEFVLYSAILAFSSTGLCLNTVKEYYGLSLDIVRCLMTYMNCRRNETESCELLLHFSFRLEKLNLKLQKGIYSGFKLLEKDGRFKPNDMCLKIVYSSFEHGDLN